MLDRARHLLISELAIVRNVTEETVVDLVQKALGKSKLSLPEPT
jgi:RNA polymerase-interacting CarD/CdnL/TRCF family regulator